MRTMLSVTLCLMMLSAWGCDNRYNQDADDVPANREVPPPDLDRAPARDEGPAERTGRIIDDATRRAADAVGHGLQEAGREIQENVPEPDPNVPQD